MSPVKWITLLTVATAMGTSGYIYRDELHEVLLDTWYGVDKFYYLENEEGEWIETSDTTRAAYYRVVRRNKEGIPKGKVRDYFCFNKQLHWEGRLKTFVPFVPNGEFKTWYKNGQLQNTGAYVDGELQGTFSEWYADGQQRSSGSFKQGLAHGLYRSWNEKGIPYADEYYLDDTLFVSDYRLDSLLNQSEENIVTLCRSIYEADELLRKYEYDSLAYDPADLQKAKGLYSQALSIHPLLPFTLAKRGNANYELKDHCNAVKDLLQAIYLGHPDSADYFIHIGTSSYLCGNKQQAKLYLHKAVDFFVAIGDEEYLLTTAYNLLGQIAMDEKDYSTASRYYTDAIELEPDNASLYLDRAWAHYSLGWYGLAIVDCNASAGLDKLTPELLSIRGCSWLRRGENAKAEADAGLALELDPDNQYSKDIFLAVYPPAGVSVEEKVTSTDDEWSKILGAILIGAVVWEAGMVVRWLGAGQYMRAAAYVAEDLLIQAGIEKMIEVSERSTAADAITRGQQTSFNSPGTYLLQKYLLLYTDRKIMELDWPKAGVFGGGYAGIVSYNNKNLICLSAVNHKGNQVIQSSYKFPRQFISDSWNSQAAKMISKVDYQGNEWHVCLSNPKHGWSQTYLTDSTFPLKRIQDAWDKGYRIIDADWGNGLWAFAMSKPDKSYPMLDQYMQLFYTFPAEKIAELWKLNFDVTALKFTGGKWLLVMSRYKDRNEKNFSQHILVENSLPLDRIKEYEQHGDLIHSIAYGRGQWVVILNREL